MEREDMENMGSFQRPPAKRRLLRNAMRITCETRQLSHDDVTHEMMALLERRAARLANKMPKASAAMIACELLRGLNENRERRRRRPSRPAALRAHPAQTPGRTGI
jgi:hypothetical protein